MVCPALPLLKLERVLETVSVPAVKVWLEASKSAIFIDPPSRVTELASVPPAASSTVIPNPISGRLERAPDASIRPEVNVRLPVLKSNPPTVNAPPLSVVAVASDPPEERSMVIPEAMVGRLESAPDASMRPVVKVRLPVL